MVVSVGLIQVASLLSNSFTLEYSVDLFVITGEKERRMILGRCFWCFCTGWLSLV
jgi:hypothetical protein